MLIPWKVYPASTTWRIEAVVLLKGVSFPQLLRGKRQLAIPGKPPSLWREEPSPTNSLLVDLWSPFNSGTAYLLDEVGVVLFIAMPMAKGVNQPLQNLKISSFDMRSISSVVVKPNVLFPVFETQLWVVPPPSTISLRNA
jgi:hypothetical protein